MTKPRLIDRMPVVHQLRQSVGLQRGMLVVGLVLTGVFVVDAEGRARFRWLRIAREWPDQVEVNAGLVADERFVAAPVPALRDGDLVTSVKEAR